MIRIALDRNARFAALLMLLAAFSATGLPGEEKGEDNLNQDGPHVALIRGPYLMVGTPTSIVVRWRTSTANVGRLWYGVDAKSTQALDEKIATQEHEITITGLTAGTRYGYSVGTGDQVLAGKSGDCHFVTSPAVNASQPVRFWAVGDSGTADGNAMAVRNAYQNFTGIRPTDFWLMLGDNAYTTGTDTEYQSAVFDMYSTMLRTSPVWPTRGNHDVLHEGPNNDYYEIFTLPTKAEAGGLASGTEAYYSFNYGRVHFICLDSEGTSRKANSPMWTWLKQDLQQAGQDWIIAYWHHPPYTKGSHDSDKEINLVEMREQALPILEQGGVDLVLCGHSHSYERTFFLDGHYGKSDTLTDAMKKDKGDGKADGSGAYKKSKLGEDPHEGAVYVVAGSSGKHDGGPLNHPAMVVSLDVLGSMVIDINGNCLDATFLEPGKVGDTFRIIKGGGGKDTTPPAIVAVANVDATHVDVAFSEPLDPKNTNDPAHYQIVSPEEKDGRTAAPITEAVLQPDRRMVRLTKAGLLPGRSYDLTVTGVTDVAQVAVAAVPAKYSFVVAQAAQSNLPFGSVWKYDASGTDLKGAWLQGDFDDSKWPSGAGQLGYGDEDEVTVIPHGTVRPSYYFRRKITVVGKIAAAKLTVVHDDGVIVWINGQQMFSKYADKGVEYSALASKDSQDNETSQAALKLDPNPFVVGENTICVMIKQCDLTSSDISFDLQLDLTPAP